jgi:FkbM family methyltransferase
MEAHRIAHFVHKSWNDKLTTARYLIRKNLAKMPYAPVPVHMKLSENVELRFWWSYIVPYFDPRRGFFDYWGQDLYDLRFLWRNLRSGMVFLDIGAHHGIYSIVAAKRLETDGIVVAFEPSFREFRRLRLHLRLNRMHWVRSEPVAIGGAASTRRFFQVMEGDSTRGGLQPPAIRDEIAETSVETVRLDDYVSGFPLKRVDIVKLDVEGGELEVLQGASNILTTFRPVFICEVLDAATHAWGYEAREIVLKFQSFGYSWFEFRSDGSIVPHEIKDHYPDVRNYLAVPSERCPLG